MSDSAQRLVYVWMAYLLVCRSTDSGEAKLIRVFTALAAVTFFAMFLGSLIREYA